MSAARGLHGGEWVGHVRTTSERQKRNAHVVALQAPLAPTIGVCFVLADVTASCRLFPHSALVQTKHSLSTQMISAGPKLLYAPMLYASHRKRADIPYVARMQPVHVCVCVRRTGVRLLWSSSWLV